MQGPVICPRDAAGNKRQKACLLSSSVHSNGGVGGGR